MMHAYMNQHFQEENPDKRIEYINQMDVEHFSLITFIDTLIPALVWESNLRFGNFHLIKMSLFIRKLARHNVFSQETERALAKLIIQHLYYLEWTRISADSLPHRPEPVSNPVEKMLDEIEEGNAHNAYFYGLVGLENHRDELFNALMQNGAISMEDTLGHSISCFYPVLEEVLAVDHPAAATALLSLILYLCRFRNASSSSVQTLPISDEDKNRMLMQASSGTSIVDIHHMITFYTMFDWEKARWNSHSTPPWKLMQDWIGAKEVDRGRQDLANGNLVAIPESYQEWKALFSSKNRASIVETAIAILEDSYAKACDWFFRVYAEHYTPDWDPHYITSLYAALELSLDPAISAEASRMALIQALEYFLEESH